MRTAWDEFSSVKQSIPAPVKGRWSSKFPTSKGLSERSPTLRVLLEKFPNSKGLLEGSGLVAVVLTPVFGDNVETNWFHIGLGEELREEKGDWPERPDACSSVS